MRRIFEFQCSDNHVSERYISEDVTEAPCKVCSLPAQRVVSAVRSKLDPISGDFPGETAKWAKMRQKQIQIERKRENS